METKIYRTTMKAARSMQIVKEDPSLHPSWLDDGSEWARIKAQAKQKSAELQRASPDALPNSPMTED